MTEANSYVKSISDMARDTVDKATIYAKKGIEKVSEVVGTMYTTATQAETATENSANEQINNSMYINNNPEEETLRDSFGETVMNFAEGSKAEGWMGSIYSAFDWLKQTSVGYIEYVKSDPILLSTFIIATTVIAVYTIMSLYYPSSKPKEEVRPKAEAKPCLSQPVEVVYDNPMLPIKIENLNVDLKCFFSRPAPVSRYEKSGGDIDSFMLRSVDDLHGANSYWGYAVLI